MPKGYRHLVYEQRCQIRVLLQRKCTKKDIAKALDVHPSTISRETHRNEGKRGYRYKQAQMKAQVRRNEASAKPRKMTKKWVEIIEKLLREEQWSPEQISGHLRKKYGISISHECIYRHIWQDKRNKGNLYKQLRRRGKKYNKRANKTAGRGLIPGRVDIEKRPKIVDRKMRVGDIEGDTIVGAGRKRAIVSLVDRKTKYTWLALIDGNTAENATRVVVEKLAPFQSFLHTMTFDNGKEFAYHAKMTKNLGVDIYFARPYHSWERGLNENTNGLVRQYCPKGDDFLTLTDERLQQIQDKLNNRPRKTLGYSTPAEIMLRHVRSKKKIALHS